MTGESVQRQSATERRSARFGGTVVVRGGGPLCVGHRVEQRDGARSLSAAECLAGNAALFEV